MQISFKVSKKATLANVNDKVVVKIDILTRDIKLQRKCDKINEPCYF